MNHTPEPANVVPPPTAPMNTCDLCRDVLIAQHDCTCVVPCGPRCWYVDPETFVPPPVPRFR